MAETYYEGNIIRDGLCSSVVSELGWWEFRYLGEDGGTSEIRRLLKEKMYILANHKAATELADTAAFPTGF